MLRYLAVLEYLEIVAGMCRFIQVLWCTIWRLKRPLAVRSMQNSNLCIPIHHIRQCLPLA